MLGVYLGSILKFVYLQMTQILAGFNGSCLWRGARSDKYIKYWLYLMNVLIGNDNIGHICTRMFTEGLTTLPHLQNKHCPTKAQNQMRRCWVTCMCTPACVPVLAYFPTSLYDNEFHLHGIKNRKPSLVRHRVYMSCHVYWFFKSWSLKRHTYFQLGWRKTEGAMLNKGGHTNFTKLIFGIYSSQRRSL